MRRKHFSTNNMNMKLFLFWSYSLVVGLVLSACSPDDSRFEGQNAGSAAAGAVTDSVPAVERFIWKLDSYVYEGKNVSQVKETLPAFITIQNGKLEGNTGCNTFSARASLSLDGDAAFTEIEKNNNLCSGQMTYERQFMNLIRETTSYEAGPVKLILTGEKGSVTFIKRRN